MIAPALAAVVLAGCAGRTVDSPLLITIDLREAQSARVRVRLEMPAPATRPRTLSTFLQPDAMGIESVIASGEPAGVAADRVLDERGFARYVLPAPGAPGPWTIESIVRAGSREIAGMSGPTGFRFGHLDERFGLLSARQILLLPADPARPSDIRVRLLAPPGLEVVTTWPDPDAEGLYRFRGTAAAADLLQGLIAVGHFDHARPSGPAFRIAISRSIPEDLRSATRESAVALADFMTDAIGVLPPFTLLLVPKAPDGSSISVPPGRTGFGMSVDRGRPTRWLTLARIVGRSALADRLMSAADRSPEAAVLAALPVYLGVEFSARQGWRARQSWYERFYLETRGADLTQAADAGVGLRREWRTAVALHALDRALVAAGGPPLLSRLRAALAGRGPWRWTTLVAGGPDDIRREFPGWIDDPPFPAARTDTKELPAPPRLDDSGLQRVDLYLGARNRGLLEQCGCKSKQMGGMARRATILGRRLRAGPSALVLELGDAVPWQQSSPMLDAQKLAESDLVLRLLAASGTIGSVVSHAELSYGSRFLADRAARIPSGFHLLSANARLPGGALTEVLETRIGRLPVRVFGLVSPDDYDLGRALEYEDAIADLPIEPPAAAIARRLADGPSHALTIAAGALGPTTVLSIHESAGDVGLIVSSDYFHFNQDPRIRLTRAGDFASFGMLDGTLLVVLESDSYAIVRLGLGIDSAGRVRGAEIESIPLDESIEDSPGVRAVLDAHYARLAAASDLPDVAPIGTHLVGRLAARYVGEEVCADCHAAEAAQWRDTPHATAFATLLARHRQGVPGCFACHVTGYAQESGYRAMRDRSLRHVQCESCHGPGERHVADPASGGIVRTPTAATCFECHTSTHSDMTHANFADYWSRVLHDGGSTGSSAR